MADNNASGKITLAAAVVNEIGPGSVFCVAYCRALAKWKKSKPKSKYRSKGFNSAVARELQAMAKNGEVSQSFVDRALAGREEMLGVVFRNNRVAGLQALVDAGGRFADAASRTMAMAATIAGRIGTGADSGARLAMSGIAKDIFGGALRDSQGTIHPDMQNPRTGNPIETKRPGEGESSSDQLAKESITSPTGEVDKLGENCGC